MPTELAALLQEFRDTATSDADMGAKFERLTKFFLTVDPIWSDQLTNVRLRYEAGIGPDVGIDLVAEEVASGGQVAIQCKFYDEKTYLGDLGTFLTASGKEGFVRRILVTTSNKWSKHAENALAGQQVPVQRVLLHDMEQSPIDWSAFDLTTNYSASPHKPKDLFPHQEDALEAVLSGFDGQDRGKLIMACGTGKTLTSLRIAESVMARTDEPASVLFLAPSISLLGQTILEWGHNKRGPYLALAVCSDSRLAKVEEDLPPSDLAIPASTDVGQLEAALAMRGEKNVVIFSTYQSLAVVGEAQKRGCLPDFDLVICDEAHRTTGITSATKAEFDEFSAFVRVHEDRFLAARKRLYMTATPRIYQDPDNRVSASGAVIASMDDESVFGPEFYRLGFGESVERGLLTDYRVLILAVDEEYVAREELPDLQAEDSTINLDDASKLVGCWRGLSRIRTSGSDVDDRPMKRAVAFANTIAASRKLAARLEVIGRMANTENRGLLIEARHVDGNQNAQVRRQHLDWLKNEPDVGTARVLTNARCLSEGIDVPALDAVIFAQARGSQVDIVQAVGRVMRRFEGKKSGYIILPVAVTPGADIDRTLRHSRYKIVWDVLNALRSHDDRFDIMVNAIDLNQERDERIEVEVVTDEDAPEQREEIEQGVLVSLPSQVTDGVYAKIVEKVGDRAYWETWATDIAEIAKRHALRIEVLLRESKTAQTAFDRFLKGLRDNLNDSISEDDAIEMLSQHLITEPVFDALFADFSFAESNPVSRVMQEVLQALGDDSLTTEKDALTPFYESVRNRAAAVDNDAARQRLVTDLYEKFFRLAFPRTADRLGIVYTPVELVDFMLHSVEAILNDELGQGISDSGVHVIDPFAGTGTFLSRLIRSDHIRESDLERKYLFEFHSNEIVLLAYYIAAINIEAAYHERFGGKYVSFDGIALADTFQIYESDDTIDRSVFVANNERIVRQMESPIKVVIGNPPYRGLSATGEADDANIAYPTLDQRISQTYVAKSAATTRTSVYDSYVRAMRWATDRIDDDGIVAFVTNNGWLTSKSADGLRKCLSDEFTSIYVLDLHGNSRTARDSAAEGGNVFGVRVGISIFFGIKRPSAIGPAQIRYASIGSALTADEKLNRLASLKFREIQWTDVSPNGEGDWIEQRSEKFSFFTPLGGRDARKEGLDTIFLGETAGVMTNRDGWLYSFSREEIEARIENVCDAFNASMSQGVSSIDVPGFPVSESDRSRIASGRRLTYDKALVRAASYRPFCKQLTYFSKDLVHSQYTLDRYFPDPSEENIGIFVAGPGASGGFAALATDCPPDRHFLSTGQLFSRWRFPPVANLDDLNLFSESDGEHGRFQRQSNLNPAAVERISTLLGESLSDDDVFHYVYGVLNSKDYQERFATSLSKMLPRVPLVRNYASFIEAGARLAAQHVNYETAEPFPLTEHWKTEVKDYRVSKMRLAKPKSNESHCSISVNDHLDLRGIPAEALDYRLGPRSGIEWVLDRYRIREDKETGFVSDPNAWSTEPRFIVDLLARVVSVSMDSASEIKGLPSLDVMD